MQDIFPQLGAQSPDVEMATKLFIELRKDLISGKLLHLEHGKVEEFISEKGTEILRLLYQGHLDERATREENLGSIVHNKSVHRYRRSGTQRGLRTIFGKVKVTRKSYSVGDSNAVFPLDAELNLAEDCYSDGLRLRALSSVVHQSYDTSAKTIVDNTASSVPKRQFENLVRSSAQDFDAYYLQRASAEMGSDSDLLVLTCDGKGIVTREKDLRPQTQKSARQSKHKKQTRLSRGEKKDRKRMATVASVYEVEPYRRTPEQVMNTGRSSHLHLRPRPKNKRVWASVEKTLEQVITEKFEEAIRRDPGRIRKWVILVDGQPAQLKQINRVMKKFKLNVPIVLDFVHVLEYLWKASYCFHSQSSKESENWVHERAHRVLSGQGSQVAAGTRRSATKRGLTEMARENADKCADYLLNKSEHLQYHRY